MADETSEDAMTDSALRKAALAVLTEYLRFEPDDPMSLLNAEMDAMRAALDAPAPEPSREVTQTMISTWALESGVSKYDIYDEWSHFRAQLRQFATLAHAAGFEAGRKAGGRDGELIEAKEAIAWANNSLFGSQGFFLTTNGGENDVHHLDRAI